MTHHTTLRRLAPPVLNADARRDRRRSVKFGDLVDTPAPQAESFNMSAWEASGS
jgi:hypothetical protein